ncbi:MAG TPA: flagellar protein FlaG [Limnochordia bacterium]|nr:flagellar protein FlaG [Limnochordia bacterium]
MKIHDGPQIRPETAQLLEGRSPKLAPKQVDQVEDVSFQGSKDHHRLSFRYNEDLGENIAHIIDTRTGKTVKHLPSATQIDHKIRIQRLMGLHLDTKA